MSRRFAVLMAVGALLAASPAGAAGTARRPAKPRIHVVQPGQTPAMIAKRYQISVGALLHANDIRHSRDLKPKQRIIVPARSDKDGSEARALYDAGAAEPRTKPAAVRGPAKGAPEPGSRASARSASASPRKADGSRGSRPADYARKPPRAGFVALTSTVGRWSGFAVRKGKVQAAAERNISRVLASWRDGQKHDIADRLILNLVAVSDHFGGRPVRVVSGFRPYSPSQYTPDSRHNLGHAIDLTIPGVPNAVLRDFCRTLPKTGCGYYPNSSFVHMDVRDTSAYWVDFAGPGEPPRYATAAGTDPGRPRPSAERGASTTDRERDASDPSEAEHEDGVESSDRARPPADSAPTEPGAAGQTTETSASRERKAPTHPDG